MEVTGPPSGQQDAGFLWPSRKQAVLSDLGAGLCLRALGSELGIREGSRETPLESANMAHFSVWSSKDPERWSPGFACEGGSEDKVRRASKPCMPPALPQGPTSHCEPQFPSVKEDPQVLFQSQHGCGLSLKKHPELTEHIDPHFT